MSKGPILVLGAAAVVGLAIAASRKSEAAPAAATPAATAPKGTTAKDLTTAQKAKLDKWAKDKGIPLDKAYDLAKSVYSGFKF